MTRPLSSLSDNSDETWKIPYLEIIAVGIIQLLLSLLIFCYGVFILQFILEDLYNLKTGLWTAIIFVTVSKITNSWTQSYCKHLDNIRHRVHKRNMLCATILLFTELVTLSFINTETTQIVFYGFLGGFLSSFIYIHSKYATEAFKKQPQLFAMMDQILKACCLIFAPHFILFLISFYGTKECQLVIGALVLNIIPASLLIKSRKHQQVPLCKFKTIEKLSIEMVDLNHKPPIITEPSSSSSSSDDEDDEDEEIEIKQTTNESVTLEPSNNIQKYYQNVGVRILPNIPEENEIELEEEEDINEICSKRLSRISAILQELNENNPKNVNLSVNNLYQPDEIFDSVEADDEPDLSQSSVKKKKCFSISSNTKFELQLKRQRLKSFLCEYFIKSVPRTLSNFYFYPAILSSCITTTLSTVVIATAPYMMWLKNNSSSHTECIFILTIIGFSWLFFLAGYPVFSKLSSLKIKILFLVGLSISGLSLFIVHGFSYDNFTLFSLTFGLGHGIISYTESTAYEDFFGKRNWKNMQGALEICTGHIVILVYLIIYFSSLEINIFLSYAYWLYVFDVVLWIAAYVTKKIVFRVNTVRRYNCQNHSAFDF